MTARHFVAGSDDPALASNERRAFLKASGVTAGSLLVGFWSLPEALAATEPLRHFQPDAFISIGTDDRVVLTIAKIEMGQGTYTSIPMLIAEELEIDLDKVSVRTAPPDVAAFGLPIGEQMTGGSLSMRTLYEPMRQAGASARWVLVEAAAAAWKVPSDSCRAAHGEVVHPSSGRRVRYGKLVGAAAKLTPPAKIALKPSSEFKVIGQPVKRLDAIGKTNGSAVFGIDALVPGMRFASVTASPVLGGKVGSIDATKTMALRGVRQVVNIGDAVAVVADNTWYARQGVAALDIVWGDGPNASLSTAQLRATMEAALSRKGVLARDDGDAGKVLTADPNRIERSYVNPLLAHAAMEPLACTVHVKADSAEIWVGSQVPARARDAAAKILGLPPAKVVLHGYLLGGAFGRKLEHDYIDQAVRIGMQVAGPVKVVWTREEDMQHDVYRSMHVHTVSASIDAKGYPVALHHRIVGPLIVARFKPEWMKNGIDSDATEGSIDLQYDIPNLRTEQIREEPTFPVGFWRGVGPTRNQLVLETFIDELAAHAGKDPLAYRLDLLGKSPRAKNVLTRVAKLGNWGAPLPPRSGRGIALMHSWGTLLAQVVELKVDESGEIHVDQVACVVDCGTVVNPDTVVAQMQGGINFGLSAALFGEITLKDGRVEQSNFHDYPVLRINEAPRILVELSPSGDAPGGIGEPGTAGLGAAFVNAVAAATGVRLYALPARPALLKLEKKAAAGPDRSRAARAA